jgi:hypothetical protein
MAHCEPVTVPYRLREASAINGVARPVVRATTTDAHGVKRGDAEAQRTG